MVNGPLNIILHQRYINHAEKREETLMEVYGAMVITDFGMVNMDYFRSNYTIKGYDDAKQKTQSF
ncbi:MAG TPA: hypothetical protein CFH81_08730 [Sulfurovum sp. UBA12169]|nr:MAG TPA: hypothetical protein CFH81_08730 [Sulfurovum sp. UBA12169]